MNIITYPTVNGQSHRTIPTSDHPIYYGIVQELLDGSYCTVECS